MVERESALAGVHEVMACAHPIRALLVEDNPADAILTQSLLTESLGPATRTRCAEGLSAALRCLKRERFDVVILDLLLPDTAGLEGLRRIVRSVPSLPVVILSGVDDGDVETEAFSEGAQEFLLKGVTFEDLGRAVQKAISRKRIETELLRFPGGPPTNVIAGDDILSAARPAEILAIGSAIVDAVRCAIQEYPNCFALFEARSLDDARKILSGRSFDAIVLDPDLPDAWSTDVYTTLHDITGEAPVLLVENNQNNPPRIPNRASQPFSRIREGGRDIIQIRRLLVSATLRKRSLEMPSGSARLGELIPEPRDEWCH